MGFAVTGLALGNIRVLSTVAEGTGKCLVLGHCLFQLRPNFFMANHTGSSWCGHGIIDLQRMVRRMATKTITGHLVCGMGFMTFRTVRDPAMHVVTESAGLFSMSALVVDKILPRALMAGKTRLFYITGKV